MKYRKLGNSELEISQLCLGSMTWGEQNTPAEACQQMDYAVSEGINFIDTAELYPVAARAETCGFSEQIIGDWLRQRGGRDKLIIASKVVGTNSRLTWIRNGKAVLNRSNILTAVESSLQRLKTDYIDLYYTHWPDRDSNRFGQLNYFHAPGKDGTPIAETLEALDTLVKEGKIRYAGVSNETPWGLSEYLRLAKENQLTRIISIQNPYNLLNRTFEIGLSEFAHREGIGLLAYSPTAFGSLSGKYLHNARPGDARMTLFPAYKRYRNRQAETAIEQYIKLAKQHALDPVQLALAYINSRPFVTGTIIGATSITQLKNNIASVNIALDKTVLREIEKIHTRQPNPSP
jgi:aryl-alcohol dehydrogenase-like predicted oxidoreductase